MLLFSVCLVLVPIGQAGHAGCEATFLACLYDVSGHSPSTISNLSGLSQSLSSVSPLFASHLGPDCMYCILQAAEFQHVRWPPHHSRHRSGGGHSSGDLLRSDIKSTTPTGAPHRPAHSHSFILACSCDSCTHNSPATAVGTLLLVLLHVAFCVRHVQSSCWP